MRMEHYFQAELRYLREQGQALTQAHPELSHYLAGPGADPDVERLLEGVAFLTASLRARMDDSFPELSLGVLQLVAPQLLRVIPSLTMMQFLPIPHTISQPMRLEAGCEVASDPIDGRSCRFRTCRPGWVYPADGLLSLDPTRLTLTLTLKLHTQLCQSKLELGKLQLYLGDEQPAACELYLWLRQHLRQLVIETESDNWPLHPSCLQACGFAPADALLPEPDDHIDGHRLLQDYFSFPAAFLCLTLAPDLPPLAPKPVAQVRLRFEFQQPLPGHVHITPQSIMLNCIPAVNLFPLDAEPLQRAVESLHRGRWLRSEEIDRRLALKGMAMLLLGLFFSFLYFFVYVAQITYAHCSTKFIHFCICSQVRDLFLIFNSKVNEISSFLHKLIIIYN